MEVLALQMIVIVLVLLIGTIICFLDGPLIIIFIWGLTDFDVLRILLTWTIFLDSKLGKVSLMWIISSTFNFKACTYNFLLLLFGWEKLVGDSFGLGYLLEQEGIVVMLLIGEVVGIVGTVLEVDFTVVL